MSNFLPGFVIGFREALEAFLVIAVILQYLDKLGEKKLKRNVWYGVFAGIAVSGIGGFVLSFFSKSMEDVDQSAKIWESVVSLLALLLITTFIFWMINHGRHMVAYVHKEVKSNLSKWGIFLVSLTMVAREGGEIVLFAFTGKYDLVAVGLGISSATILTILIFYSLVKANLQLIFNVTLGYLILQAGFLFGYGIHEGLSALKGAGHLSADSPLLTKVFDLSGGVLDHKQGAVGLPLYVAIGWYSKPEWLQFIVQYAYTIGIFAYWRYRALAQK